MLKKLVALLLCCAVITGLVACGKEKVAKETKMLSAFTDFAIFKDIPAMDEDYLHVIDADDYGMMDYLLVLQGMKKTGYDAYIEKLKNAGYTVYADNGPDGVGNSIYSTVFTKDDLTLTISFMPNVARTYIAAAKDKAPSPHLLYDPSYVADNIEGAKTTLTMHQLGEKGGNCYILQLKNGHFIICDGGDVGDYENLVSYLESLVPEGEVPHVEAWFMSHEHGDHLGFLWDISGVLGASRVTVDGFYYNRIPNDVHKTLGTNNVVSLVERTTEYFYTADNKQTPVYRCHAGDRYYFNDINVEVLYTNEQILEEEYTTENYNSSCTWLMFNIEGQKFLNAADAEIVNMRHVDDIMDASYMDVDMMNVHHHGVNVYMDNLDYYKCETLLYSGWCTYTIYYPQEVRDAMLKMQDYYCEEYMSYVYGSVVLTFPYTVGSYETLPSIHPDLTEHYTQRSIQWMKDIGRSDLPR